MSAPRRGARIAALGAAIALSAALGLPLCPIAAVTRRPCPGCGLGRATIALLRGHLAEAIRLHPLSPVVGPLVVGFVGYACFVYVRRGRWPGVSGRAGGWIAVTAITLWTLLFAVWIARFQGAFGGPVPV